MAAVRYLLTGRNLEGSRVTEAVGEPRLRANVIGPWGLALIVIATAFTGLTAIYIASVQGASRILLALARHRLLSGSGPIGIDRE